MNRALRFSFVFALLLAGAFLVMAHEQPLLAQTTTPQAQIVGTVHDRQNQPIARADVQLRAEGSEEPLAETRTQPDGTYKLQFPAADAAPRILSVQVQRSHFAGQTLPLESGQVSRLRAGETVALPDLTLLRRVGLAFWIATLLFVLMLVLIATGKLHNTLASLFSAALLLGISYLGGAVSEDFFVFDFSGAVRYVDWNVIFLIMGMMIVIAVVERTGIFQWLAFFAYRLSGGRIWLLLAVLMVFTGIASALLDNVTTMLLMVPITVQISMALGMNPLALLLPEVLASNVFGISTLVGTPTNILIGSYAHLSFNDFLKNQTPGVLLAMIGLILYTEYVYRRELRSSGQISPVLLAKLEEGARIREPGHLKKVGWVGLGMLVLFVTGEQFELPPAVTALLGATALLLWIQPNIEEMIEAVDWTTLVFFITLFIVVGAIQEVGLISFIADFIGALVGNNLVLTMLVIIWFSAVLSTVIPNIPFAAALLPIVTFLSTTVPGADNKVLFYCLSVGAAMGGNGSLIGASANMVTAGIAERAGYPITFNYFLKKGFPAMLLTVALATVWLLVRFLVIG